MDERGRLNDEKRTIAGDSSKALQDVFARVFQWQITTRGCTSLAAYRETTEEIEQLLDAVKDDVVDSVLDAYYERKQAQRG